MRRSSNRKVLGFRFGASLLKSFTNFYSPSMFEFNEVNFHNPDSFENLTSIERRNILASAFFLIFLNLESSGLINIYTEAEEIYGNSFLFAWLLNKDIVKASGRTVKEEDFLFFFNQIRFQKIALSSIEGAAYCLNQPGILTSKALNYINMIIRYTREELFDERGER